MLIHYGADIEERHGSAVAIELNGKLLIAHRPHPQKEAKRYAIRELRDFLAVVGLVPDQMK